MSVYFFIIRFMAHFSEEFTQKYALSKTLRFELKPVGKTQEMLEGNKVFLIDENIKKKYIQTKPFLDQLHREFIQEALSKVTLSGLENFFQDWKEYKKDKKAHEKSYKKASENLRKEPVSFFDVKFICSILA